MGTVYVVEQLSTGKLRALKLMLPQLVSDPSLRKRFEQEARVGARIESEHIVDVVGAGVDAATGTPWLAMELLQGEDLATRVQRAGPIPLDELLRIFGQLCHAVAAAHDAGIVHRDLKPENIFLAQAKRAGVQTTVKVLDFGIAKLLAEARTTATAALGSPTWMAPEQTARGSVIGPATDVWALGLIAFFLLTGRHFWRCAEDDSSTLASLLREVVLDPMPLASERAREFAGSVPAGFDSWFLRAVNREPSARFPSVRELLEALEGVLGADAFGRTIPFLPAEQAAGPGHTLLDDAAPVATRPALSRTVVEPTEPSKGRARPVLYVLGALLVLVIGALAWATPWRRYAEATGESPRAEAVGTPSASASSALVPTSEPAASVSIAPTPSAKPSVPAKRAPTPTPAPAHSQPAHVPSPSLPERTPVPPEIVPPPILPKQPTPLEPPSEPNLPELPDSPFRRHKDREKRF